MNAVLGIDTKEAYRPALDLLAKLCFPDLELSLLHVAPTVCPITGSDARVDTEFMKVARSLGLSALDAAKSAALMLGLEAATNMEYGRAADEMVRFAKAGNADLVAVCATHHGTRNSSYLGSATCALAIGSPTSLLVAKGPLRNSDGLRVVLATDNSTVSERWIEKFIGFAPTGISELHVVNSYEVNDALAAAVHTNLAMLGGDVGRWIQETMNERTEATAEKLKDAGFKVSHEVVEGSATDAIYHALTTYHADLLVLGAHGAIELPNAKIGSVALHEVVAEPYPVLLVRA
jgi:nucleotide-binding universal stress UspA family protein